MIKKITVANLNISAITKTEFLFELKSLLSKKQQAFITTPNSEFLYAVLGNESLRNLFNSADLALPDGVAIFWAEQFLAIPFHLKSWLGRYIEVWWQVINSGARILLTPKYLYTNIPEKITGADVFYDLVQLAAQDNYSMFFVNHRSDSAQLTAKLLQSKYPGLQIVGNSRKNYDDATLLTDIREAKPDIVLVSYGQPIQERWIAAHLKHLPVTIAIGIGGTFDYAAGFKTPPPRWVRSSGLEWLFRLFTQPSRVPRIYQATLGLVSRLVNYKLEKTS